MGERIEPTEAEISAGWDLGNRLELGPDYLGMAIASVEHRHGMSHGEDPDHCDECAAEARRRMQAECEHDGENVEITTISDVNRQLLCQRCGAIREVPR